MECVYNNQWMILQSSIASTETAIPSESEVKDDDTQLVTTATTASPSVAPPPPPAILAIPPPGATPTTGANEAQTSAVNQVRIDH